MKRLLHKTLKKIYLDQALTGLVRKIRNFLASFGNRLWNEPFIEQQRDYRRIPIIIISFNQLFYLKKLIEALTRRGYYNLIIIDNCSTYPPLLEYLAELEEKVTLYRMERNYGHKVFWQKQSLFNKYSKGYYALTDADVVPTESCPSDFLLKFKNLLDSNPEITKVGFSLKIDDIPDSNPYKEKIIKWEKKFWSKKRTDGHFNADIDTTFALYRPRNLQTYLPFFKAIRTNSPYTALHGGWYFDPENLTEEQKNYFSTANDSSSWKLTAKGELKNQMYK